jgi:hypothetical protein
MGYKTKNITKKHINYLKRWKNRKMNTTKKWSMKMNCIIHILQLLIQVTIDNGI